MSVVSYYRNPVGGDTDSNRRRIRLKYETLTSFPRADYISLRQAFGEGTDSKTISRIIQGLEGYAKQYWEFFGDVKKIESGVNKELGRLGLSIEYKDVVSDYQAALQIVEEHGNSKRIKKILKQAYLFNSDREQYLQDVKKALTKSICKMRIKKREILKGVAFRSLAYIFGAVVTAINPPIGIGLIVGTSGEVLRYAVTHGYHRVKTNLEVEEDLNVLKQVEPVGIETALMDISLYPEKVQLELGEMAELEGAVPYKNRVKKWYQKLKLKK